MVAPHLSAAQVWLWDAVVGTVTWDPIERLAHFAYHADFLQQRLEVAPMTMPLGPRAFAFPGLNPNVFKGLPGFLADSLPDKFGTLVIDTWLTQQGLPAGSLNPVERLCLIGSRGMGALEYSPNLLETTSFHQKPLDLSVLVELINIVLGEPQAEPTLTPKLTEALQTLLRIGVAADGSRAKAVVAWHPNSPEVWPGHAPAPDGFDSWLMKFDGISGNRDREASDPQGWGVIEYAYHLMARAAGIQMMECRLLNENGRRHFITRRFDRTAQGDKVHRQSLCAMGHMDFDALGAHSYEEVMDIMRDLRMSAMDLEEQFRRMVFNVLARNHDDHPKNVAFLMDREGHWSLAPAYDLTFAYNPEGRWTNRHQMTLNGKRDNFVRADFSALASRFGISSKRADDIMQQVASAVTQWPALAEQAGVAPLQIEAIAAELRLHII